MATLPAKVQRFAVRRLAQFDRPSEVRDAIRETYAIEVTLPQLGHYDPTTSQGGKLSEKLCELFHEEREKAKKEIDQIPLAHRPYRLRQLQKLLEDDSVARNVVFRRDTVIEAEKVMGEMYTNKQKHELTGADGSPLEVHVKRTIVRADGDH